MYKITLPQSAPTTCIGNEPVMIPQAESCLRMIETPHVSGNESITALKVNLLNGEQLLHMILLRSNSAFFSHIVNLTTKEVDYHLNFPFMDDDDKDHCHGVFARLKLDQIDLDQLPAFDEPQEEIEIQ